MSKNENHNKKDKNLSEIKKTTQEIYSYLNKKHEENEKLLYLGRTKEKKGKLNKGLLFRGNENYIQIPFYKDTIKGGNHQKAACIQILISLKSDSSRIDIYKKKNELHYNQSAMNLIDQHIKENFSKVEIKDESDENTFLKRYYCGNKNEWKKVIDGFLDNVVPSIDNIINNYDDIGIRRVTKTEFEKSQELMRKYEGVLNDKEDGLSLEEEIKRLLLTNKNIILHGAPGTGKTFLANKVAELLLDKNDDKNEQIEFVQFHPSYDYTDFVEGIRPTPDRDENGNIVFERTDGIFKKFIKKAIESNEKLKAEKDNFQDAWKKLVQYIEDNDYYEFSGRRGGVHKFKVVNKGSSLRRFNDAQYSITKEQLYSAYRKEGKDFHYINYMKKIIEFMKEECGLEEYKGRKSNVELKKYIIIIDEINRGEVSKIFGELFYCIENKYRGNKRVIKTQYQNMVSEGDEFDQGFYVPENVYIIGTMNDIDRSVESLDFAMRRRFCFINITPEDTIDSMLGDSQWKDEIENRLMNLNECISNNEELGDDYKIGASYFLSIGEKGYDKDDKFEVLWTMHLKPLLQEYVRMLPNKEEVLKELKNAYGNTIDEEGNDDN